MKKPKLISVVLPVFNEAQTILVIYKELTAIFATISAYEYEIIFVNDGSADKSWNIIQELAQLDPQVHGINFSRNFGHQVALKAGYDHAQGDAVICMDADMEHPPALIPLLVAQWESGFDIVYVKRINRNDAFLKRKLSQVYYKIIDSISDVKLPRNVADYRLVDKKVVEIIKQSKEHSLYLRGMVAWTGFKSTSIESTFDERAAGVSGYTWSKMFKLAFDGFTSFSLFPLKIAAFVGTFVIITGCTMFAYITIDAFLYAVHYPLFKWLVTILYIFMGVQFILLWLVGEYIGRMYEEQKGRPLYIVDEVTRKHTLHSKQIVVAKSDRYCE